MIQQSALVSVVRVWGAAAVLAVAALPALAQSGSLPALDAGTVLPVTLNTPLSSADSHAGDPFTARVRIESSGYYGRLPAGTEVGGHVRDVRRQSGRRPGTMDLAFDRLLLPGGRSFPLEGSLIGLDNGSVNHRADGRLVATPGHRNDKLTYAGYGAGAGLIVGLLSKRPLEDTLLGGGLGYVLGSLQKQTTDYPRNVALKAGTEMGVRLDRAVAFDDSSGNRYGYSPDSPADTNSYGVHESGTGNASGEYRYNPNDPVDAGRYHKTSEAQSADDARTNADSSGAPLVVPGDDSRNIGVLVGQTSVHFSPSARPIMQAGNVMVPVAPVLMALGIAYDTGDADEFIAHTDGGDIQCYVDSAVVRLPDGRRERLPARVQRIHNAVYVPVRFLALVSGGRAQWDAPSRTVLIDTADTLAN